MLLCCVQKSTDSQKNKFLKTRYNTKMLSFAEVECAAVARSTIVVDVTLLASARGTGLHYMSMLLINLKKCPFKK